MIWIISLITSFIYASLIEYCAHRWAMHSPGLGKIHLWEEHAIQHHGHHRNDVNIVLSALTVLIGALPLVLFYFLLGWVWVVTLLVICILYAALWSTLHASYHGVGRDWVKKIPFYNTWLNHHLVHHDHPSKNFGTIFIWTDFLFGTKQKTK